MSPMLAVVRPKSASNSATLSVSEEFATPSRVTSPRRRATSALRRDTSRGDAPWATFEVTELSFNKAWSRSCPRSVIAETVATKTKNVAAVSQTTSRDGRERSGARPFECFSDRIV